VSEFMEVARNRRSIRRYTCEPLSAEQIATLKEAMLRAPSSRGLRAGRYVFVTDRATLDELSRCKLQYAGFLAGASLGVVVAADERVSDVWVEDAAIAATFLQLAAADLGLGSCWVQIRERDYDGTLSAEDRVRQICGMPREHRIACIVSIGVPAEEKPSWPESHLRQDSITDL